MSVIFHKLTTASRYRILKSVLAFKKCVLTKTKTLTQKLPLDNLSNSIWPRADTQPEISPPGSASSNQHIESS